ncbi:MAG: hypothetical protein L6R36_007903 [Xanthoria steineri]|nr:MAG: hypothetical protein L6R36_007903 [Xanthoria steineri]
MGNDGGSIPTRRELVKEAAKDPNNTQVKETQTEKLQYYWSHCSLSQKILSPPIVSDSTGNLYNKDAVLENLLNTTKDTRDGNIAGNERTAGTIKSLRDIVEVRFSIEEEEQEDSSTGSNELRLSDGLTHSLKKAPGSNKKRKQTQSNKKPEAADKSKESRFETPSDAIRNEDTAALTAKVLAEQEDRNKRRKVAPNENLKALFSSSNGMAGKQSDFMTRGFAIPPGAKR